MIVKALHVKNFRSILDQRIDCDNLTVLVGRNGTGKSSFLRALEMFYDPKVTVSKEDFYAEETDKEIEIAVTFTCLGTEEKSLFAPYLDGHDLVVARIFSSAAKSRGTYHGMKLQNPDFTEIRNAGGKTEIRAKYNESRNLPKYSSLPAVRNADQVEEELKRWEDANPGSCMRKRDDGQFFGFPGVGQGYIGRHTRFILIPAVRDAVDDAIEGKGSCITEIMDLVVRRTLANRKDFVALKADTQEKYRGIMDPEKLTELVGLQTQLSDTLRCYAPEANVSLDWINLVDIDFPLPKAEIALQEDGYQCSVQRTGHGLQRVFILTRPSRNQTGVYFRHTAEVGTYHLSRAGTTAPSSNRNLFSQILCSCGPFSCDRCAGLEFLFVFIANPVHFGKDLPRKELTMLQHLVAAKGGEDTAEENFASERDFFGQEESRLPDLMLAIEEPELYQHPSRQRYIAAVLLKLAQGAIPGVARKTQVLYTTHSPLFVGLDRFEQVRLLRKADDLAGKPRVTKAVRTGLDAVAEELWIAGNRQGSRYSGATLRPRLQAVMTPWVNEGFFADVAVLVEGEGDRAAILGVAKMMKHDFDSDGISVIPCMGKNNLDRPLVIFRCLGIPVYVIWDADYGQTEARAEDNRRLLRLLDQLEEDWPHGVKNLHTCFKTELEETLAEEIGKDLFNRLLLAAQNQFGIAKRKDALKNPAVLQRIVEEASAEGKASPTLKGIVERIVALKPPRKGG